MRFFIKKIYKNKLKINDNINFKKIRLIDNSGKQLGIFFIKEAILKAKENNKDLVLIDENKEPPICKIIDYKKYIYNKNKFLKIRKKNNNNIQIKEIQIKQNIDKEDYKTKLNNIKKFLEKKFKVKITLKFKGREIIHNEIGFQILKNISSKLEDISKIDFISNKIEGKQIIMILSYKK